jgi:hypothetical protein
VAIESVIDVRVLPENLTPAALASPEFSASDLMDYVDAIKAKQAEVKALFDAQLEIVAEAIEARFGDRLAALRKTKPEGKVSFREGSIEVSTNVSKKPTWDSGKVNAILKEHPEDIPALAPKITVVIPEKNFKGCREDLRVKLEAARTVTRTESKISMERKEA